MANADAAFGFRPVNSLGHAEVGQVNIYYKASGDSQPIFIGDAVTTTGTAHTDEFSTPIVEQADVDNPIRGVMVGKLNVNPDNLTTVHSAASTGEYLFIADDPNQLFEVQEDSDGGALAAIDTGLNIDILIGAGSTVTGISKMEINSDASKGTSTAQLRLVRISTRLNNALGNQANWIVKFNEHELGSTTGL